jgi:cyclopropane-fatty-acyl-phospholipid synthase
MMLSDRILNIALAGAVKRGTLNVVTARGKGRTFGDGDAPRVTIRFADTKAVRALLADPELQFGELFMDGRLIVEEGSIYDFLQLMLQDSRGELHDLPLAGLRRLWTLLRKRARANDSNRAKRNVAHHYDLDGRLYALFLDADRQYSCAYFETPDQTLDEAQLAKKRHIAAKLCIEPGMSVLDIGSGWGGLAIYLAKAVKAGAVKGITLSEEQLGIARQRTEMQGLSERLTFALEDYRVTQGTFDRIVSVGMFEHVGVKNYDDYFMACRRLLKDDGVMLLHTIGRSGVPAPTNPWITRYIFPGGHLPTLSEMVPAIERSGLIVTDIEVLRLHYALTLRAWRERFLARREEAKSLYDERFCRMWECYLAASEAAFRFEDLVVFQIQLAKRNDGLPMTRSYIAERERTLQEAEAD